MSRIYEELPCGCLVSEDGGGAFIPCEFDSMYDQYSDKPIILSEYGKHWRRWRRIHKKCIDIYFENHDIDEVWHTLNEETITTTLNSLGGGV